LILLDTSGLLATLDRDSRLHEQAKAVLEAAVEPIVLSPFVLAELDYLVAGRLGTTAELDILEAVTDGTLWLVPFTADDVGEAAAVIEKYRDLRIGLTDASLVVLAGKLGTEDVLTLDERHFRALTSPRGRPFRLLPADA
jgi:predicted nucleic acid-binding protein